MMLELCVPYVVGAAAGTPGWQLPDEHGADALKCIALIIHVFYYDTSSGLTVVMREVGRSDFVLAVGALQFFRS